ncbi:unnamed protein product, partial [Darwinula stevensoni]
MITDKITETPGSDAQNPATKHAANNNYWTRMVLLQRARIRLKARLGLSAPPRAPGTPYISSLNRIRTRHWASLHEADMATSTAENGHAVTLSENGVDSEKLEESFRNVNLTAA